MKKITIISAFLLSCLTLVGQTETAISKELNNLSVTIVGDGTDAEKLSACNAYEDKLVEHLNSTNDLDVGLDSLTRISVLKSKNLVIYNWALPHSDGTFTYFAVLHIRLDKENTMVIQLVDKSNEATKEEYKTMGSTDWYGALYYKLIVNKKLGKNTYTLLGWDGNNLLTNKKIIEVLTISNKGIVKFGAPLFKTKKRTQKRVIFEYAENVVMSLKYHNKSSQIIFDYLVPTASNLKGVYEYYGPSLNRFDSFLLEKKKWVYQEDINIELNKSIKDFMWNDPKKDD